MASGFLFIDGRDPDSVFASGSSGVTTGLKHASSGADLGTLYASGNSGITTGLKDSAGNDIGGVFALPAGGVPINGSTYNPGHTTAGTTSSCTFEFATTNATWTVLFPTGGTVPSPASGSIPSGATSVSFAWTQGTPASPAATITNGAVSPTALTSGTLDIQANISHTAPGSGQTSTGTVTVKYYNSGGSVISTTVFTVNLVTAST